MNHAASRKDDSHEVQFFVSEIAYEPERASGKPERCFDVSLNPVVGFTDIRSNHHPAILITELR